MQHPGSQAELEVTGTAVGLTIVTSWQAKDILFIHRNNVVPFFFIKGHLQNEGTSIYGRSWVLCY